MDNFSKISIMQKIEELREKQRQEEEKLLRQQEEQRKLLSVKQQKLYETLGFHSNDYEGLQNQLELRSSSSKNYAPSPIPGHNRSELSSCVKEAFETTQLVLDDAPAANPNSNFHQLLQDKLDQLGEGSGIPAPKTNKPKQKFLKKGEGLARFRMKSKDLKLKPQNVCNEKIHAVKIVKPEKTAYSGKHQDSIKKNISPIQIQESANDEDSTLKQKLCLKEINPGKHNSRSTLKNSKPHACWTRVAQQRDHYSPGKDSIENSFLEKVEEAEKRSKKEQEELKVFELLEEQAQNSSFCSNSSLLARLMNDSVKSTPIKSEEDIMKKELLLSKQEKLLAGSCFQENNLLEMLCYGLDPEEQENIEPTITVCTHASKLKTKNRQMDWAAINECQQNLHVRFSDKNDYKSGSEEEISCHSEEGDFSSPEGQALKLAHLKIGYHDDFQDNDIWSDGSNSEVRESEESSIIVAPNSADSNDNSTKTIHISDKAKIDTEELNLKNSTNNAERYSEMIGKKASRCVTVDIGVNTEQEDGNYDNDVGFSSYVLRNKLQDLEREIEIFRKENANLQKAQQQHQQEVTKFLREKKDLENRIKEEREKLEFALQEERRKLQRQKMVFDKCCKETRKSSSKQEREEIQALKQKIQDLQEEIHKKDSKWSALQAQSRDRQKYLEKENHHLKEELEIFKKAKASQKAKTIKRHQISKTKILHAINDHIAKVPQNDLEDAVVIHDVVPKKISAAYLEKINKTTKSSTCSYSNVQEVNQHAVPTADKKPSSNGVQGYFESPKEYMMPHSFPILFNDSNQNPQTSLQENIESCTDVRNCNTNTQKEMKQNAIGDVASAYASYSYFIPQISAKTNDSKTLSEANIHSRVCELPKDETLKSESQYDRMLQKKITENTKLFSEDSDENKKLANRKQNLLFNNSRSYCSNSDESPLNESNDPIVAVVGTPNSMNNNDEKTAVIEKITPEGNREKLYPDGRQEIWYANGNVKKISADHSTTKTIFYNGDVRERLSDGTVKYYFAETKIWQTTYPDGSELMEYSNGQTEFHMTNGIVETTFPDLTVCTVYSDGRQKHVYKDGKIMEKNPILGTEITIYPNGQREICSKDHMRLEYPDGTVKMVYPDGLQETRYFNGRIRIKDKEGRLIMDSLQHEVNSFNLQSSVT